MASVAGTVKGLTVDEMRSLGGFTRVIRDVIKTLPHTSRTDHGSEMWPRTISDELVLVVEISKIRLDSQRLNRRGGPATN